MEKIAKDERYAWFSVSWEPPVECDKYQKCEVVSVPFTEGRFPGGRGWIFPKRSPFLPIFNKYYWELKEAGFRTRIKNKPEYRPNHLLPEQECETLDGHPISMHKVISLFAMFFGAFCCSFLIFRCVGYYVY